MNIYDYGFTGEASGTIARVTAVHRERHEIVCAHGLIYARLKTKEYYSGSELFPTT